MTVADHRLDLEVFAQTRFAPFAAISRALVAAEGRGEIRCGIVQVDTARTKLAADLPGALDIAGLYVRRQTVFSSISNPDSFVFAVITHDGQHRSKDLFSRNGHVGRDVREDRRFHVVALR